MNEVMKSPSFCSSKKMLSLNSSEKENVKRLAKPASARVVKATPNTRQKNSRKMTRAKTQSTPREIRKVLRAINRRFTQIFADHAGYALGAKRPQD